MKTWPPWLSLSLSVAWGCGGATSVDSEAPPHQGPGIYDLTIERVADDCLPPLVEGAMGPTLVVVGNEADRGANVPLFDAGDLEVARQDVSFDRTRSFDVPAGLPGCEASRHFELAVSVANSERIEVAFTQALSGFSACPSSVQQDCTSKRLFHFRWLKECLTGGSTVCASSE